MKTLGDQIRSERERGPGIKLSGQQLAEKLEKKTGTTTWTKHKISKIESGNAKPTLEEILCIHEVLYSDEDSQTKEATLREWMLSALTCLIGTHDKVTASRILERVEGLFPTPSAPLNAGQRSIALSNFPLQFAPLHIIAGDRREQHPKDRADLLCYSASMIDLVSVPRICEKLGGVRISSDKILYRMSEKWKKEELGNSNLLVIGSPAANLFARIVNKTAPFRFRLGNEIREWQKIVESQEALAVLPQLKMDFSAIWVSTNPDRKT
jgi:hypothetical protein